MEKYVEYSKDKELLKLLNFYKCYRAYVRAQVISFKLTDPSIGKEEKKASEELCIEYFNLALEYAK